ncbi:MAG: LysE family translocator [Deltaproteobacteria bacterium]|jgi:threonine/homoserine/homoserine lactone efflux protein|nr:LysE family translocator [Deltaproteobacteria bacterium]MBW2535909.1 LysE family translocator [Deltaproteobacteria bacterium]
MPLLEGYLTGLALIVLIGPVLFVLVQSTLERGRGHGFAVALGIFVSDVIAVSICGLGAAAFLDDPRSKPLLALGGAIVVLALGLRYVLAPAVTMKPDESPTAASWAGFFARGFLVNFVNPFVFMVWLGIIGAAGARHGYDGDLIWFMGGAVLGVLTLDSLKVLLAHRLRPLLRPKALRIVFRVSGLLLVGFGVRLLAFAGWSV